MANYTNVIASNICDASGNKLASGTVSFQATDAANQPLNFQVGGGGQVVTTPATAAITAGAIAGGFQVADSANTSPAGVLYRITITDTTLNRAVVTYSLVTVTGATFSLDTYTPTGASVLPPVGGTVNGPLTVTGNLSVTGTLAMGALAVNTATIADVVSSSTPAVDVRAYGATGNGSTDDTAFIQAAINAAAATKRVYFPTGVYKITGLNLASGGYEILGDAAQPQTGSGGTVFSLSAAGAAFSIGTDNGHAHDANEYDGPQGTIFKNCTFTTSLIDGTLLNGFGNYGLNTYGIRDWRGGSILLNNVRFKNLNYGFWGIQSDINRFSNVITTLNSVGLYLGPRSDNFQIWGYNGGNDDTNVWIDGAAGGSMKQSQLSGGSPTTPGVKIGTAWSVTATGISFDDVWVEGPQVGLTTYNSIFMLGKSASFATGAGADDALQTSQIVFSNIYVVNNAVAPRVKYLIENGNADNIQVNWLHGVPATYDSVFQFSGTTSPTTIGLLYNQPNAPLMLTNSGSGTPVMNRLRWATGRIYLENGTDAAFTTRLNSGRTATQDINFTFASLDANKFNLHWVASSNTWQLEDGGSSGSTRLVFVSAGLTSLNSLGTTAVQLNVKNGASTGGTAFGDGLGNVKATVDGAGKATFAGEVLTAAAPSVSAGQVGLGSTHATTVGAAGGATAPPATPLGYLIINVDGTAVKVPYYNS